MQRNKNFDCLYTDITSAYHVACLTLNYVEKFTKDDAPSPQSPLYVPPHFILCVYVSIQTITLELLPSFLVYTHTHAHIIMISRLSLLPRSSDQGQARSSE